MSNFSLSRGLKTHVPLVRPKTTIGAAVFVALYGLPHGAGAQQAVSNQAQPETTQGVLAEVTVTASRREQTLESVPYSLSVVSGDELTRTGVTDLASLTAQVPGLSMYDVGARYSGSLFPVIRGINATAVSIGFHTLEQAPVGTYIDNSPIDGYLQLDDVQRVEVLRGPQGTLYGAGALGGALRIIPNAPVLNSLSGSLEASGGTLAHSSGASYTADAVLNVPIGETLAFRASGKYSHEPGFIDVYGLLDRTGSPFTGTPVLANPADPVDSPGIFSGKNDWNDQNAFTGRASLLWKPDDKFNAQLAYTYADVNGNSGPVVNTEFQGGPYPLDPRITFPPGGEYQFFTPIEQPFSRRTTLGSLDLSYDVGFATVSATSSYYTTDGDLLSDQTYIIYGLPSFVGYYAGNPVNPRFIWTQEFADSAHTFTQEVRLVSNTGPDKRFDYTLGVFYETQTREGSWDIANPGSPERSVAQGCTGPISYNFQTGMYSPFPNCLLVAGPDDVYYTQEDTQHFRDLSEFGEFTWHFARHAQITAGVRHFEQDFTDVQSYSDLVFGTVVPPEPRSSQASKNTWKINSSYEYATSQFVYALWSQGFRRGGANAIPLSGAIGESNPALLYYSPDSTNNYEVGIKGRLANGLTYTFAVFDIEWDNPQVAGQTPVGNFAVWNAKKAASRGVEFDLNTPLFVPELRLLLSAAYADAKFTENYLIPADMFGNISGLAGQQLPGSPKTSAAATLNYDRRLGSGYDLLLSLNDTYRSAVPLSTFPGILGSIPAAPGMNIVNLSAALTRQPWHLGIYVTNLMDKWAVQEPAGSTELTNGLANFTTINQPREIFLRLGYSF